ncbi:hypothetical protein ACVJDU_008278 [Bradyrhizobium diazoefficiens]
MIQNTQRQPRCSVMKPPMAGPMISAQPVMLLKMPSARARLLAAERAAQDRHCERHHQRGAGALQRAGGDQRSGVAGERAGRRCNDEQGDPGREHAAAPEAVAECGARQEQHGEGQVEGVDGPLQRLDPAAEFGADGRECRRDDHGVQRHHEGCQRGDAKHPVLLGAIGRGLHRPLSVSRATLSRRVLRARRGRRGKGCAQK